MKVTASVAISSMVVGVTPLVGYSGGGAISTALVSRHPDRVLSLALLEPAWVGNEGMSEEERELWAEFARIRDLPAEEMMPRFVRAQLAPGVEPPPRPPGPAPTWMAKRPAGIRALLDAFQRYQLDPDSLRAFARPVYYALGLAAIPTTSAGWGSTSVSCSPTTLEVYDHRHHFDPPHRAEPERLAARLRQIWESADPVDVGSAGP